MTPDEFVKTKVLPEYLDIVTALRALMKRYAPQAEEVITYGILGFRMKRIIAVLNPTKKGITFAFSRGTEFEDTYGLLEGVGKVSKNLRFKNKNEINPEAFHYYVRQAVQLESGK